MFFSLNKVEERSYFQTNLEKCIFKKKNSVTPIADSLQVVTHLIII